MVDVFAGPGGLNEGFSRVFDKHGNRVFNIAASFEMEANAVQTLRLRSAIREISGSPDDIYRPYLDWLNIKGPVDSLFGSTEVATAFDRASSHVHEFELGPGTRSESDDLIRRALTKGTPWVLIGGPPCQAYSLVGRARRAHDPTFEDDHKHFLYREYLHIIEEFRPSIFVMENVKGLLSAGHGGRSMFDRIIRDLSVNNSYEIRSLVVEGLDLTPQDYVIRAELYGVPQRRHRVILLGVRKDAVKSAPGQLTVNPSNPTVWHVLAGMKPVKSRVSRAGSAETQLWNMALASSRSLAASHLTGVDPLEEPSRVKNTKLEDWLRVNGIEEEPQHRGRRHMQSDLIRYGFLARLALHGQRPRVMELPECLRPKHRNIDGARTPFVDRFKVQEWDRASSTIASHISKDGHYYIHPDPEQMRSLTVREAARLQTFPDDYYFMGTQTQQYHQVGNAVPPLLARQIAQVVADALGV